MNNPFHIEELDYSDPDNDSPAWEGIPDEVEEDDPDFEPNEADGDSDDDEEEDEEVQLPSHIPTASGGGSPSSPVTINIGSLGARELLRLLVQTNGFNIRRTSRNQPGSDDDADKRDPAGWSTAKRGYKDSRVPSRKGINLLRSGEFGRVGPTRGYYDDEDDENGFVPFVQQQAKPAIHRVMKRQRTSTRRPYREDLSRFLTPNSHGTMVATYSSNAYSGQFSADSSFFYTCCQDFRLHIYNTTSAPSINRIDYTDRSHKTTMASLKTINGVSGRWTITDSHLSPDNQRLIYSSITSTLYMTKIHDPTDEQHPIFLGQNRRRDYGWSSDNIGIFSCRFSTDGREVVAGGNCHLFVYDLTANERVNMIRAHEDDVNSCCWADVSSGNVLVSASDDHTLKVWDRRSLGASGKPSGVLVGHTEGVTHVSPRGDGRYVISNGKDQVLRLWDLRKMKSSSDWDAMKGHDYGIGGYDYRYGRYPKPRFRAHPQDCSVMQYRGHRVLRTLIRCHFSPEETTGGSYIASGSSDGMIHIWSLDGSVVQVLDRSKTQPFTHDPSAPDHPTDGRSPADESIACVRDVSWHTKEPVLMSCAWEGSRTGYSSVARHEWKGWGKNAMSLQDVAAREREEREATARVVTAMDQDDDWY